jgi:hypothetical protein
VLFLQSAISFSARGLFDHRLVGLLFRFIFPTIEIWVQGILLASGTPVCDLLFVDCGQRRDITSPVTVSLLFLGDLWGALGGDLLYEFSPLPFGDTCKRVPVALKVELTSHQDVASLTFRTEFACRLLRSFFHISQSSRRAFWGNTCSLTNLRVDVRQVAGSSPINYFGA